MSQSAQEDFRIAEMTFSSQYPHKGALDTIMIVSTFNCSLTQMITRQETLRSRRGNFCNLSTPLML